MLVMKLRAKFLFSFLFLLPILFLGCNKTSTTEKAQTGTVTIAYAEPISSYSPLNYEAANRKYLSNIYEPLVHFDGTFNLESGLAVSWGRVDDFTWEFHLRVGVLFQNGQTFSAADAVYSINQARSEYKSDLTALLSTISSIEEVETDKIRITTEVPDSLLLNRLTYVYIFPNAYTNFDIPVGTGPYRVKTFENNTLSLERFPDYWGPAPYFEEADLTYIASPDERVEKILSGDVDILANVPPLEVDTLEEAGIKIEEFPSLETSFLMLNLNGVFADDSLRSAVYAALGTNYADRFGGGYLMALSQFAATGITGYSSSTLPREQNMDLAKTYRANHDGDVSITLDVPEGIDPLAEAIKDDLSQINITVKINTLSSSDLENKITSGASDAYFFGWKYDLADLSDFFESVVHSRTGSYGAFNGISYKNPETDQKIEDGALSEVSNELLKERIIIPLFESKTIYGIAKNVIWPLRLDGQIWASDILKNVLE